LISVVAVLIRAIFCSSRIRPLHAMPSTLPNLIEIRLRGVSQLYNSLDPSPFHEKDLDDDAEQFITSWAMEYPLKEPLALMLYVEEPLPVPEAEQVVTEAIHHFYAYRAETKRRELRELLGRGRTSLLIGLGFLALCITLSEMVAKLGEHAPAAILRESLFIIGWVALWRPLEIFLYDWWPIRRMVKLYDKLSAVKVGVVGS
jgi:hypothetical protein